MLNRKTAALLLSAGALLAGGCQSGGSMSMNCPLQKIQNAPPDELNDSPLVVDGAMQLRDWQRVSVEYANGDTPAGPTGFLYEPRWNQPEWVYAAIETPLFIGQTVALPVVFVMTPPWTPVTYKGATIEATYNAMPALPGVPAETTPAAPTVAEPAPVVPEPVVAPATQP
jgi:hypothetical protein